MTKSFESFEERILSIDAQTLAAIDAELEAERNDPNYQPKPVAWRDDPDPFGMDWKWAEPEDAPSVISFSAQPKRSFRLRSVGGYYGIGAAVAASLLIGVLLGGLAFRGVGWRPSVGETDVLLASVTPKFGTLRGAEQSLLVEVGSVRPGFATIITLAPDRAQQVFPEPGEEPIRVAPSAPQTYGPLPRDSTTALVLVTETPATDLIREALLTQEFRPGDIDRLGGYLRKLLAQSGYRSAGMSYTPIVQGEKK